MTNIKYLMIKIYRVKDRDYYRIAREIDWSSHKKVKGIKKISELYFNIAKPFENMSNQLINVMEKLCIAVVCKK